MKLSENSYMTGMRNSMCARTLYESEIVTSILNNSASWIGIPDEIIDKHQDCQNRFILGFFEAPKQGTPTGVCIYIQTCYI